MQGCGPPGPGLHTFTGKVFFARVHLMQMEKFFCFVTVQYEEITGEPRSAVIHTVLSECAGWGWTDRAEYHIGNSEIGCDFGRSC